MPKISERTREERRRAILEAALRCFTRNGYQQTSMVDIITESGLSAGAIYGYFSGKQDLIRGVALLVIGDRRSELSGAASRRPLSPADIARLLIDGVRTQAPMPAVVQVWAEAAVDQELRTLVAETVGGMRETIASTLEPWGRANPEQLPVGADPAAWARATAPVLMSLIPGFALQKTIFGDFDEERFLAAIPGVLRG
ncbi:TetR/AcrR family transcriptional regulator [Microbacterium sp. NPDC055903]